MQKIPILSAMLSLCLSFGTSAQADVQSYQEGRTFLVGFDLQRGDLGPRETGSDYYFTFCQKAGRTTVHQIFGQDDPISVELTAIRMGELSGHSFGLAGREGTLAIFASNPPQVLLQMPNEGWEARRVVRFNPTPDLPRLPDARC